MKLVLLYTDILEMLHQLTYFFLVQFKIKITDLRKWTCFISYTYIL